MATAAMARQSLVQVFDWHTAGAVEILPLIPAIQNNRLGIDPPADFEFVVRLNASDYFVRFPIVKTGIVFSPNVARAYRCENLIEAATFAVFVKERLPLDRKTTLFVEAVRKEQKSDTPALAEVAIERKTRRRFAVFFCVLAVVVLCISLL